MRRSFSILSGAALLGSAVTQDAYAEPEPLALTEWSRPALGIVICAQNGFCNSCVQASTIISNCAWCPDDERCYPTFGPGSAAGTCGISQRFTNVSSCPAVVPQQTSFDLAIARDMMRYAYAAYYDDPTDGLGTWSDAFAFIGLDRSKSIIMLAFRGSSSLVQVLQELLHHDLVPVPYKPKALMVNQYFFDIVNLFIVDISESLAKLRTSCPDCRLWLTGHSLGGALAVLVALDIMNQTALKPAPLVYTFGQPRVGNGAFADYVDAQLPELYRMVNSADAVPHIPPCSPMGAAKNEQSGSCGRSGYYHPGTELFFPHGDYLNGVMCGYRECVGRPRGEDDACSNSNVDTTSPPSIADHHTYWDVLDNGFCQKPQSDSMFLV